MSTPIQYATDIMTMLDGLDSVTAGIALRIATALLEYRVNVEANVLLAGLSEQSQISDELSRLRNA